MKLSTCLIDDFGPLPVVQPTTVADIGESICRASANGQAIYPVGGRTLLQLGHPPTRQGIALDLTRLADLVDYPARDMTVTVQAGMTVARLQHLLALENQRLPVDVPCAEHATVGGSLAANVSGPRRYGFGTLRDYLIGISLVNDEGKETKAGGRVVKNVAGYDLCKLAIGSLGTLGVITQVTLKLRPRPEEQGLVTIACSAERLGPLLDTLHVSRARPVCLEVLSRAAVGALIAGSGMSLPQAGWVIVVGFEDNGEAVSWQIQHLLRELPRLQELSVGVLAGDSAEPLWVALGEFGICLEARLSFKANVLPSATAAFCLQALHLREDLRIQAHAGNGIVKGHLVGDISQEQAVELVRELSLTAAAHRGNLVVTGCPPPWKRGLPIWGAPRDDHWLMRRIKETLDPRCLFNPGRFLDVLGNS